MTTRGVRKPRKPKRPTIPSVQSMMSEPIVKGVGNQFLDQRLTPSGGRQSADFGGQGLPTAPKPLILPEAGASPKDIAERARIKRLANRRRTSANIVTGYVQPGLPPAVLEALNSGVMDEDEMSPDAFTANQNQLYAASDASETAYVFPQVSPTKTINPLRPRTLEAGYEKNPNRRGYGTLRVRFRDGTPWQYYDVEAVVWQRFKRSVSPGRFINRVLNKYEYERGNF